jgi:hypothetical protein
MKLRECLENCSKQLYHLVSQYGTACLLGDKTNASTFNAGINDTLRVLDELIRQVDALEKEHRSHADIMSEIEDSEDLNEVG